MPVGQQTAEQEKTGIGTQTMKAVRIHAYGGPEVLRYEDAKIPELGTGEVLVRVRAAGVNPVDWKIREGLLQGLMPHRLPLTLGWDLSGVVETAGPGIPGWKKGDEVYTRPDVARNGAYAEYIAVQASELARKPRTLDHLHAAAVPLAALTAWQALFEVGGLTPGQKVLIHAAAGGVGSFAVQFAKWKGARVVGTASGQNRDFVTGLGADEFVDYRTARFEDIVHDADLVLDTIGGETLKRSWGTLRKGGILIGLVQPPSPEEAAAHGARQSRFWTRTKAGDLAEIARLIDEGKVRVAVETVLPLSEARLAHEISQSGHARGKIVLQVS